MKLFTILPFFFLFSFVTPVKAFDWKRVNYHPSYLKNHKIHKYDKKLNSGSMEIVEIARIKNAKMKREVKQKSTPFTGRYLLCHSGSDITVRGVGSVRSGEIERKVNILTVMFKQNRYQATNTVWKLSSPSISWSKWGGKCYFITPAYGSGLFNGWQPRSGERVGIMLNAMSMGSKRKNVRSELKWFTVPTKEGITEGRCPSDRRNKHWKTVNGKCVPSCGAAKGQYCLTNDCGGHSLESGSEACKGQAGRTGLIPLTAFDVDKCCLQGPIALGSPGRCPASRREPHWKTGDNRCRPSCGSAKGQFLKSNFCKDKPCEQLKLASGKACQKAKDAGKKVQYLESYQSPCCMIQEEERAPASVPAEHGGAAGGGSASACSPRQQQSSAWKEVSGQCLPSCGAAKGAYCSNQTCRGYKLASGKTCRESSETKLVIPLNAWDQKSCCLIEERERKRAAGTYRTCSARGGAWYPSASNVCQGVSFTQHENCRRNGELATRQASGTAPADVWIPSSRSVCQGTTFTQKQNCRTGANGYEVKTRLAQGSKRCRAPASE